MLCNYDTINRAIWGHSLGVPSLLNLLVYLVERYICDAT